jgi:hypothetical protein
MGRSVSYPTGALVCFEDISAFEDEFDYIWFTDDLKERAGAMFPSLYDCDKWRGREDHILMRNAYVDFGVSEYCGLEAIWIAERCDGAYYGHMSNGEGVYQRKPKPVVANGGAMMPL